MCNDIQVGNFEYNTITRNISFKFTRFPANCLQNSRILPNFATKLYITTDIFNQLKE